MFSNEAGEKEAIFWALSPAPDRWKGMGWMVSPSQKGQQTVTQEGEVSTREARKLTKLICYLM